MTTAIRLFLVLFLGLASIAAQRSAMAVSATERAALIQFYQLTNGNQWFDNSGWCKGPCPSTMSDTVFNDPGTECDWYGVGCLNGKIDELKMDSNNLSGSIYTSKVFFDLPALETFYAANNHIAGNFPQLGSTQNLWRFNVNNNQLTGPIQVFPNHIMFYFEANRNQLTGSLPQFADYIVFLDLSNNQLSGPLPSFTKATMPADIRLDHNDFSGPIPTFPAYPYEEYHSNGISLSYNHLSGPIPPVLPMSRLYYFDVSHNELTGTIPELPPFILWEYFSVADNQLTGNLPLRPGSLHSASLCPNPLNLTNDPAWDAATGFTPWWSEGGGLCEIVDFIFANGFE